MLASAGAQQVILDTNSLTPPLPMAVAHLGGDVSTRAMLKVAGQLADFPPRPACARYVPWHAEKTVMLPRPSRKAVTDSRTRKL